jgi:hypothetical protein
MEENISESTEMLADSQLEALKALKHRYKELEAKLDEFPKKLTHDIKV